MNKLIRLGQLSCVLLVGLLPLQSQSAIFFSGEEIPTGSTPSSVAAADLDGDGNLDLAVANEGSTTVSVLLGDGLGGFAAKVDYAAGDDPSSVTTADVDGDGNQDLIVANRGSGSVSVLLGDGLGGFAAKVNFVTGAGPVSVTAADLNGDGNADLAVVRLSGSVSVLLGDGLGGFAAKVDFATGTIPVSGTVADVDGDGNPDLLVTNAVSTTVSVLLGDGLGAFAASVDISLGFSPVSVTAADVNGDGNLDLAVLTVVPDTVSVLLGDGLGGFAAKVDFAAGGGVVSVTAVDVDGDGNLDLAVANGADNTVSVLLGDGLGGFAAKVDFATGSSPSSIIAVDVNGDGDSDLVVANKDSNTVSVLLNLSSDADVPTGTITIDAGAPETNTTAVSLALSCDDGSGSGCVQMQFSNDNATFDPLLANANSALWTLAAGADGVRTVFARFVDAVGNVSTAFSDTIRLDTQAPAAPVISLPVDNTSAASTTRPTISGTAEVDATVTVNNGVTMLGMVTATGGNWSLAGGPALTEGTHNFNASATDAAGNIGAVSSIMYTVDVTVPAAPGITSPVDNTSTTSTTRPTISGTAEVDAMVVVSDGATLLGMVTATGGSWSLAGGPVLTDGVHNLNASVTDAAGNTSAVSSIVYTVDATAPVITLQGDNPLSLVVGTAFSEPGSTVTDNLATGLTAVVSGSVDINTVGSYTLTYTVSDTLGNAAIAQTRTVEITAVRSSSSDSNFELKSITGGCSLNPTARFDPTMLLMVLLSILYMGRKKLRVSKD